MVPLLSRDVASAFSMKISASMAVSPWFTNGFRLRPFRIVPMSRAGDLVSFVSRCTLGGRIAPRLTCALSGDLTVAPTPAVGRSARDIEYAPPLLTASKCRRRCWPAPTRWVGENSAIL